MQILKTSLELLSRPIHGYNNPERIICAWDALNNAHTGMRSANAGYAAAELQQIHKSSRLGKFAFSVAGTVVLGGAILSGRPLLPPMAGWLLVLARDERRAEKAVAPMLKSKQFKAHYRA